MYIFLLIYLIINTTVASSKTIYKVDKRSTPDPKLSCKNIKCPPIEDRVCVKVTQIDKQKHEKFILAINKCNMQFMKCHPAGKKHNVTLCGVRKAHALRKISEESSYEMEENTDNRNKLLNYKEDDEYKNIYYDVEKHPRDIEKTDCNDTVESELGDVNDDLEEEDDKEKQLAANNDEEDGVNSKEKSLIDKYDDLEVGHDKKMKPADNIDRTDDEKNEVKRPENDSKDLFGDNNDNLEDENNQTDLSSVKIDERDDIYKEEDAKEDDKPLYMEEDEDEEDTNVVPDDYDQNTNENVNSDEYKKNCPTKCPAREVMVCAKCQHNIHRSFLSLCHLRAFNCKHPDEKLELVNRKPCIQSAPYLTDLPAPKGKLSDISDKDIVLQFIRCRENGRLNKDDPRCKF